MARKILPLIFWLKIFIDYTEKKVQIRKKMISCSNFEKNSIFFNLCSGLWLEYGIFMEKVWRFLAKDAILITISLVFQCHYLHHAFFRFLGRYLTIPIKILVIISLKNFVSSMKNLRKKCILYIFFL